MDFSDMGRVDAETEINKFSYEGSKDLITASIRLDANFLDMLSALSGTVGMARQPFMSRLIEVYAVDAIADYVCGYLGVFSNEDTDLAETLKRFYPDNIDDKWKDDLELFFQLVEKEIAHRMVRANAYNSYEGEDKAVYFEKYIKPKLQTMTITPKVETK